MGLNPRNNRDPHKQGVPQLEDGFARIANEILEAIARTSLTDYESRCIHFLWRKTYGWHDNQGQAKKVDAISYSQWAEGTHINRRNVIRTLQYLVKRKIITKTIIKGKGRGAVILWGFQKRYYRWEGISSIGLVSHQTPKEETKLVSEQPPIKHEMVSLQPLDRHELVSVGKLLVSHQTPVLVSHQTPTIDNKDNIQKISVSHTPKLSGNPFIAKMQTHLGFPDRVAIDPVPNPGKEAKFIKKMQARGFCDDEIFVCWRKKVDERREFVSMQWVNEDIGRKEVKTVKQHGGVENGPIMRYGGRSAVVRELYRLEKNKLDREPEGFTDRISMKSDEELLVMLEASMKEKG